MSFYYSGTGDIYLRSLFLVHIMHGAWRMVHSAWRMVHGVNERRTVVFSPYAVCFKP